VTVQAPGPPTADELIERLHQRLTAHSPRRERKPGEFLEPGDEVECDIITMIAGHTVPGGVKRGARFELREFLHLPGFIDQLLGTETFSAQTFELTLPEDYGVPEVAGQVATYYVENRRAFQIGRPELDDAESLKAAGLGETLEQALEIVAQEIDEEQGQALLIEASLAVLDALAHRVVEPIPEAAIDEELRQLWQKTEGLVFEGKPFSQEMTELALEDFLNNPDMRGQAAQRIKVNLALGAIIEKENLKPTEETMTMLLETAAADLDIDTEQAKQSLKDNPQEAQEAVQSALYQQAVEYVVSRAKIEVLDET
jgi:trigger factor